MAKDVITVQKVYMSGYGGKGKARLPCAVKISRFLALITKWIAGLQVCVCVCVRAITSVLSC